MGDETPGADDAAAVQILCCQRRGDLVVPRRDVERLVLIDAGGAMRRVGGTEAIVERRLKRGGVVGRKIADGAEAAVFDTDRLEISE
jgi:hypothetical protein